MWAEVQTVEVTVIYDLIKKKKNYVASIKEEEAGNDFLFWNEIYEEMHVFSNYLWKTDMCLGIIRWA